MMRKLIILFTLITVASISIFGQKPWTKNGGVNIAKSSKQVPAFPRSIIDYRSAVTNKDLSGNKFKWSGSIRVGSDWTGIPDFPNTIDTCTAGVFMIRWRTRNRIPVKSSLDRMPENEQRINLADNSDAKTGKFGYMYASNCNQPLFKVVERSKNGSSTAVDIYYELKFWKTVPYK